MVLQLVPLAAGFYVAYKSMEYLEKKTGYPKPTKRVIPKDYNKNLRKIL